MKPDRIFLIRHGESVGNVNKEIYRTIPDYALDLTDKGISQAFNAGQELHKYITDVPVQYYVSPFWRTRRTFEYIRMAFKFHKTYDRVYEDPRIREQEWGHFRDDPAFINQIQDYRDHYGHFYYRFNDGESCADVFDRVSDFMNTLHRDFEKRDYPRNTIIVSHGMTIRLFLMRWFHTPVEEFEKWANPKNGEIFILERNKNDDKYSLVSHPEMRTHVLSHTFQYKWLENK